MDGLVEGPAEDAEDAGGGGGGETMLAYASFILSWVMSVPSTFL